MTGGHASRPRLGLSFDLRNTGAPWPSWPQFYSTFLDFVVEAERSGVDVVKLTEHHGSPDGYMPQPLTMLSAIAARTTSIELATGVLIAPLHHVVDVAEQAAIVDCISAGRLELGIGAGYVPGDFAMFGVARTRRLAAFETLVRELRRLWTEEIVTPPPPHEIDLWAGVRGPRGSRLAGRLGMKLLCLEDAYWPEYQAGLASSGYPPSVATFGGLLNVVLSDDPPRTRATIARRIDDARAAYQLMRPPGDESARARPFDVQVMTPEEAATEIRRLAAGRKVDTVYVPGLLGGWPDEVATRSMQLLVKDLRQCLESGPTMATAPA